MKKQHSSKGVLRTNRNILFGISFCIILALTAMAFQDSTKINKSNQQAALDTVPKNHDIDIQIDLKDLDQTIKRSLEMAEKSMKEINWNKISKDVEQSMRQIDMAKLQMEINNSIKAIDWDKMKNEIDRSLKEIDKSKIKIDIEKAISDVRKNINPEEMKKELEMNKKQWKLEMEKAKEELKKAKKEHDAEI